MLNQLTDYYFWSAAPSLTLTPADKFFMWLFVGIAAIGVAAIILSYLSYLNSDKVMDVVIRKFKNLALFTGLSGLVWFGIRYENTPIFGSRYWAGLILVMGLVWLGLFLKYLIFDYKKTKVEYERETLKNKYLPRKG